MADRTVNVDGQYNFLDEKKLYLKREAQAILISCISRAMAGQRVMHIVGNTGIPAEVHESVSE